MVDQYQSIAVDIGALRNPVATGFVGFWAARPDRFDQDRFPFGLDRSYMLDMTGELPRFTFAGAGVKTDNGRDLTGQTIEEFDHHDGTTRTLKDHMGACVQREEPMAWKVTANPCGRRYSFVKLYLPYPNMLVTASWVVGDALSALSRRQRDIAELIALGHLNKQIAHELGIAETTVEVHVKAILRRLRVKNRTEIATAVLRG